MRIVLCILTVMFFTSCKMDNKLVKTCLEGHLYWSNDLKLASILDDNGKPVRCGEKTVLNKDQEDLHQYSLKLLALLDANEQHEFYKNTDSNFQKSVSLEDWKKAYVDVEKQVGAIIKRKVFDVKIYDEGRATVTFYSNFKTAPESKEIIHYSKENGQWLVAGIFVRPRE